MPEFTIILVEPKYEGNIGSVARAMGNFGFSDLILVNPPELEGQARAMAMHGRSLMESARIVPDFKSAIEEMDFLVATTAVIATDKNVLRTPIFPEKLFAACDLDGKIGLVFGREDYGLYNEEIEECDLIVSIPSSPGYPTLNLSHSVAVILYELSKQQNTEQWKRMKKFRQADKIEKKVLLENFDIFAEQAHRKKEDAMRAKKIFRKIIGRGFISGKESFTLIGLFRKALKKMKD